ncbi:toprim domain-containing protein [Variovorax rhizosphaerae]|uniref:Toprim domain-containing protein n=1 Tax=Variovorax rhizosphaerae TaxID=1836200 RepID=A0ABU8WM98_9BURK
MHEALDLRALPLGEHRLRCPECGREQRGDKTYSLRVMADGRVVGQCFRCGLRPENLREREPASLAAKAQAAALRAQERARQAQRWRDAALAAVQRWDRALPAIRHEYLAAKQVRSHGLRMEGRALLVPVRDMAGRLHSLQVISPGGEKRYLRGGRIAGGFHLLGHIVTRLVIAEGYATAASYFEDTGVATVIGFDAGNLLAVARAFRERLPGAHILMLADDDRLTPGNPGRTKAEAAARAIGADVLLPDFTGLPREPHHTDYNDARCLRNQRASS